MKIPGFNLWNWPTQRELERINADKAHARALKARIKKLKDRHIEANHELVKIEQKIKEREFLYYLRSGRLPE